MKRFCLILFSALISITAVTAGNWCEILIGNLNAKSNVDKTMAVNREPETHEITNATYSFRFKSRKLYHQIFNTLKGHSAESDYYSESGGKYGTVLLRFSDNGKTWSCKLQNDRESNQFLITVKSDGNTEEALMTSQDVNKIRRQAEEIRRQAQQMREERRRAQEQSRRQAQQAKEERRRAQEQSRSIRESGKRTASGNVTTIVNEKTQKQKDEIAEHEQALRQAQARRKQLLGL